MKQYLAVFLVGTLLLAGCSAGGRIAGNDNGLAPAPASDLSPEEQEQKAFLIFEQILDMPPDARPEQVLARKKMLYRQIIDTYPGAVLSQECYWRLISLYVYERKEESSRQAEALFKEFQQKYPDSKFMKVVTDVMAER